MGALVVYTDVFYANLGLSGDGIRSRSLAPGINWDVERCNRT